MVDDRRTKSTRARSPAPGPRKPRFDVVGFGALNLDRLYAVPQLIRDGGVEVLSSVVQAGGSAANTIYALAKLGLRCGFVGTVGDDDAGKALLGSFREVGVDTGGILVRPGAKSGETLCITAGQGQKAIYIIPGANSLLDSAGIDLSYLSNTRHVHLSSFVGERAFWQQLQVVEKLPAQIKASLALDAVYARRGLKALSPLLKRCAVLFANAYELRELTGQELLSAAHACLDIGCEVVVVTFGSGRKRGRGEDSTALPGTIASMIMTKRRAGREAVEHTVPAIRIHDGAIADTTGAGDAFAAGFLFGLLQRNRSLPVCGALGHTAAGFCLTKLGARAGLPTRRELLARFEESFGPIFARERKPKPALKSVQEG